MDTLEDALDRNAHLRAYLDAWQKAGRPAPSFHPVLSRDLKNVRPWNFLYPVGDPVFVHVHQAEGDFFPRYDPVEPALDPAEAAAYEALRLQAFLRAPGVPVPDSPAEYRQSLEALVARAIRSGTVATGPGPRAKRLPVTPTGLEKMRYLLFRDVVEHGPLEPIMRDPWIEDVHALGLKNVHVVHKVFGMSETPIRFHDGPALNDYLSVMAERMGRPVSESRPIVDGALPNGSRINIVYGEAVSKGGSSFTIRKFSETPITVTQLVEWNTMSARLAAYLWLCLETGMRVFVSGETASGKTTTLNALLPFMRPKSKVLSVEDTPEVVVPHPNWQQLITRERGSKGSSVTIQDLLKAALRSRPNYIIVGEIRGAEGSVAFQAMQTGHPTLATFHASGVGKLVQRFTSDPINVPAQFMDNLNVALIQSAVYVHGKMLRRVTAVEEIEGFSKLSKRVMTRQVFSWDPVRDQHQFDGRNNSYVLETLVAERLGIKNPREIYAELERRTRVLEELVRRRRFEYDDIVRFFFEYAERNPSGGAIEAPEVVAAR